MIINATFTSQWDNGEIATDCKVNTETHEVFDVQTVDVTDCEICEGEYITINGEDFQVVQKDEYDESETDLYWYE